METFFEKHSAEMLTVILSALVLGTLLLLLPQLLRWHSRSTEMLHAEHMRALEAGQEVERPDLATRMAGRTATLVPMVVMVAAATVTSFLAVNKAENLFSTSLVAWLVAGAVSLAAITGGVTLMGRLAGLQMGDDGNEARDVEAR
jgi:hypothetical protein